MIYRNDDVDELDGIGIKTKERLNQVGIVFVSDLMNLDDARIEFISSASGSSFKTDKLKAFRIFASEALNEDAPLPKDHSQEPNPYESMYGDQWKSIIDKKALVGMVCVTELIDHMFEETKKMVGSDDYWVAHDALSVMTAKESVKYMKQKHYYEHWVKPECGLLDSHSSTDVQKWKDKPVGNNPKYMPLDNNLNNDLHASVLTHCIMTQNLDDNDKKKFDMSTPVQGTDAYTRIWEHHPPSKRIVEDINLTYDSLRDILVTKGALRKGAESHKRMHDRKFSHGGKQNH